MSNKWGAVHLCSAPYFHLPSADLFEQYDVRTARGGSEEAVIITGTGVEGHVLDNARGIIYNIYIIYNI